MEGDGVRGRVVPLLVLLVVFGGSAWLDRVPAVRSEPVDLEADSAAIGWHDPLVGHDIAYDIYHRVNDERAARGLPALAWHEGLAARARGWSEVMIATRYEHSTPEWRAHPDFAGTGENIFMGPRDAMTAHVGWMESDGHRNNLLYPGYSAIGIGVVCRNDGYMWATQILGVPHGSPALPLAQTPLEPVVRRDGPGPACPPSRASLW